MSTYAAQELIEQYKRGPSPGEEFFRLKVTGSGETKWINVSRDELTAIIGVVSAPKREPEPEGALPPEQAEALREYGRLAGHKPIKAWPPPC